MPHGLVLGVLALGAAILALAAGFCLADLHPNGDAHHDGGGAHHGVAFDACLAMVALTPVAAPLMVIALTAWVVAVFTPSVVPAVLLVLDPPPK